ncbi:hypothetical protein TIFTF001_029230 [Ficus carica]|uniref:Uncharacterized protein n=1 Tax=Ficus carica TaxID=3494 RepID=A0AA88IXQ5_FICCA|nr:hypothetical protein TIFTF001_029230 [Ficus carica]
MWREAAACQELLKKMHLTRCDQTYGLNHTTTNTLGPIRPGVLGGIVDGVMFLTLETTFPRGNKLRRILSHHCPKPLPRATSASPPSLRFCPPSIFAISDRGDRFRRDRRRWRKGEISGKAIECSRAIGAPIATAPSRRSPIAGDRLSSPRSRELAREESSPAARPPLQSLIWQFRSRHRCHGRYWFRGSCGGDPPWLLGIIAGRLTAAAISDLTVPEPP